MTGSTPSDDAIIASQPSDSSPAARLARGKFNFGLVWLFGLFYFAQGITEPTEGLISQPVRSLLQDWGYTASKIGLFSLALSIPWCLKPAYGMLSDFVPLWGLRRRSYLLLSSGVSSGALLFLWQIPSAVPRPGLFLFLLILPTIGVAFSDVVIDALMVERGQPVGLTGLLQSVQWTSIYAASIFGGLAGGYFSADGRQSQSFLVCSAVNALTFVLALFCVREEPRAAQWPRIVGTLPTLRSSLRTPGLMAVAGFLVLWNFNPFATLVLQVHMTRHMGFSEQFFGETVSWMSLASMVASMLYGFYCRRVPMGWLVHLSIAFGVLSTLAYWAMRDESTARIVSLAVGFTNATAVMVQLDLAAQACPPQIAGTIFASLMSLMNLSTALSGWLGGALYDRWAEWWGHIAAFDALVGLGSLTTAFCWLLMPWMNRFLKKQRSLQDQTY